MGHNSAASAYNRESITLFHRAQVQERRGLALRVAVIGLRNFPDRDMVFRVLDRLHRERGIVQLYSSQSGDAQHYATVWAHSRRVEWVYRESRVLLQPPARCVVAFEAPDWLKQRAVDAGLKVWALRRRPAG